MSGAYTVTGAGQGAAYNQKGPGNGRNFFVPQVTPHIVATGVHDQTGGGTETVTLSAPLVSSATEYMVILTARENAVGDHYVDNETDAAGVMVSFDITTAGAGEVNWMVVKTGQGLEVA